MKIALKRAQMMASIIKGGDRGIHELIGSNSWIELMDKQQTDKCQTSVVCTGVPGCTNTPQTMSTIPTELSHPFGAWIFPSFSLLEC